MQKKNDEGIAWTTPVLQVVTASDFAEYWEQLSLDTPTDTPNCETFVETSNRNGLNALGAADRVLLKSEARTLSAARESVAAAESWINVMSRFGGPESSQYSKTLRVPVQFPIRPS